MRDTENMDGMENKEVKSLSSRIKSSLTGNLFLKLLSLFLAIIIWAFVMGQDTAVVHRDISGIHVEVIGETSLNDGGFAVKQDISSMVDEVKVRIQGAKKTMSTLNTNNVRAVIDLSKITTEGEHVIEINVLGISGLTAERITPIKSVTIDVEKLYTKSVPIRIRTEGEVPQGYMVGDDSLAEVTPKMVTISGTRSDIESIKSALVVIDLEGVTESIIRQFDVTLVDENSLRVDAPNIKIGEQSTIVNLPVYRKKTVPVVWAGSVGGELPAGFELLESQTRVYPEEVVIAGLPGDIDEITQVYVKGLDISGQKSGGAVSVELQRPPAGVVWISEEFVNLAYVIEEERETKTFTDVEIMPINKAEGIIAQLETTKVDVTVTGPKSFIQKLTRDEIEARVDLSSAEVGSGLFGIEIIIDTEIRLTTAIEPEEIRVIIK